MELKEFREVIKSISVRGGGIDHLKVKYLDPKIKNKLVTFLINTNRPVREDFVTESGKKRLLERGYFETIEKGGVKFMATHWQKIHPDNS